MHGEHPHLGLIPACAGKTPRLWHLGALRRAHPRVCGENHAAAILAALRSGSSPRVRGKRGALPRLVRVLGLIPACAGKTLTAYLDGGTYTAHPRVCGENLEQSVGAVNTVGSSPRVRGKLNTRRAVELEERLIPACAGKTFSFVCCEIVERAHPRVCGEN